MHTQEMHCNVANVQSYCIWKFSMRNIHYYYYYYYKCQDLSDAITTIAGALYKVYQ